VTVTDEAGGAANLWPLKDVVVTGLFGMRSFAMPLDASTTIVTGENGSGKSTVLRAVHLLSNGHWLQFHDLPLESIELIFADQSRLQTTNTETGVVVAGRGEPWVIDLQAMEFADPRRRRDVMMLRRELESRARVGAPTASLRRRLAEMSAAHGDFVEAPEWIGDTLAGLHTKLISARRLEHRLRPDLPDEAGNPPESVVERYALEMRDRMRDELSRYAAESQQQEKSLPSRIVHAMQEDAAEDSEAIAVDVDKLRKEVRGLADLLARVGLFDEEEDPDTQFEGYPRNNASILLAVREVYRVARDRLSRLSRLRAELDLFATFLNDRLAEKRIDLNQTNGIDVVLSSGERIRPSELSSGEQQLLALAYELLFETKPHSVVLLDEPELSLHVAWLKGLIAAFMNMGEQRKLQFLIATHSPSILAGHIDRERSLDRV
jgi:energy-coupling factor transporter ATP-binding protein EcfA2